MSEVKVALKASHVQRNDASKEKITYRPKNVAWIIKAKYSCQSISSSEVKQRLTRTVVGWERTCKLLVLLAWVRILMLLRDE